MGAVCGKWTRPEVEVDMSPLYEASYVSEGNKQLEEKALCSLPKMSEAEWNIIMTKGASGWRMQLPPPPQQEGANEADFRNGRAAAEKSDRRRNFRESVALAIAPNMSIVAAIQQNKGCEVDIVHEGCCTVRFDTLAPHVVGNAEGCEKSEGQEETRAEESAARVLSDVAYAGGGFEEPRKQATRKPQKISPKPIVLQSTLPLPPQSELYFEVEFVSLQSQLMKPQTLSDISHVTVGVAPRPYPQQHLPGVLSHSCSISTSGAIHVGTPDPVMDVDALVEGDVLGVLLCRRSGTVLFLLNGAPLKSVACKDILFSETDPSTFTAPAGFPVEPQPAPGPDMYVTLGVIGRGECEVNFGGKSYTAHGYIKDIGGGIIQSNAPIQARAFGQRLANFSQMLAELQLFYQIYCPHMLPKAKGMVVMNVSRRERSPTSCVLTYLHVYGGEAQHRSDTDYIQLIRVERIHKSLVLQQPLLELLRQENDFVQEHMDWNKNYAILRRKLYNFLSLHDPSRLLEVDKILQTTQGEIERINALLMRVYHADLTGVSLRRKQSIGRMLREYHTIQKVDVEATKLDRLAEEALQNPAAVDKFLREKYGKGVNMLLQKRLEQIYDAYAPENKSEIGPLMQKYPLFDDEYHMACKLKVKYNLDLYMFSPLEEDKKEIAAIRRNLRPTKMSKQLKLLEAEDLRNTPTVLTDNEGNRTPSTSRGRSRVGVDARERKSIRRASRAAADMVAAVAAATAAAHAAENAAAAAAAAAANVKEQGINKEKIREEREKRRRERDDRRKSRLDKEALRDLLEMQLREQAAEEAAAETALNSHAGHPSKETQRLLEQKQQVQQKRTEIEEKKKAVESALKVSDQEWWDAMRQQEKESDEEWEALEKQQQVQVEQELPCNSSPLGDNQANGAAAAAGAKYRGHQESSAASGEARKAVRLSDVATGRELARNSDSGKPGGTRGSHPASSLKNSGAAATATAVAAAAAAAKGPNGTSAAAAAEGGTGSAADAESDDDGPESGMEKQRDVKRATEEHAKGPVKQNASSGPTVGQQPEAQSNEEGKLGDTGRSGKKPEGGEETAENRDSSECGLSAVESTSCPGAAADTVRAEIDNGDQGERRECAATQEGGGGSQKERDQHEDFTKESTGDARDLEPQKLEDRSTGRVSFAATIAANEDSNEKRVNEGRIVAGEAKSFVDDIVRRSSVKAIDASAGALPRDSAAETKEGTC